MTGHTPQTLETVLRTSIPEWKELPLSTKHVSGGMTNENFCVQAGDQAFFVRLSDRNSKRLGIDRNDEYAAAYEAAKIGVGPQVHAYFPVQRILITHYIAGRSLISQDFHSTQRLDQFIDLLYRVHQSKLSIKPFSVFAVVGNYWNIIQNHPANLPENIGDILSLASVIEDYIPDEPTTLCHNDLLAANFLADHQTHRLWLVDWEYAGRGSLYFDLGNFCANQELPVTLERYLVERYFSYRNIEYHLACVRLMRIMSDIREAFWGLVQHCLSPLSVDFLAYAELHLKRVEKAIEASELEMNLKVIAQGR